MVETFPYYLDLLGIFIVITTFSIWIKYRTSTKPWIALLALVIFILIILTTIIVHKTWHDNRKKACEDAGGTWHRIPKQTYDRYDNIYKKGICLTPPNPATIEFIDSYLPKN